MTAMICSLLGAMLLTSAVAAQTTPAQPFADGDVVAFVGDSITHSGRYHRFILDYYLTRFPERKIKFVNCGIAGDSAAGAVSRLEWDILPNQPNAASLMLGMNDIGRGYYGKANPDEATLQARQRCLDGHKQSMAQLAQGLADRGVKRFVVCTPSPYDDTVQVTTENLFGCNAALATCGQYGRELAAKYQGGVVDFNTAMTAVCVEGQKTNPAFTIIGQDRVHPADLGHLIMAFLYLKAQGVPALVSRVAVDGVAGKLENAENCAVTGLQATGDKVSFDYLAKSLPWPIDDAAKGALALVPLEQDLDQEVLQVKLAGAGLYRLSIDGQAVGDYSGEELARGVNLALNPKTPQYQQARQVVAVNEQRRASEYRIRTHAQMKMLFVRAKLNEDDVAAVDAYMEDFLKQHESMRPYFTNQYKVYRAAHAQLDAIRAEVEALTQKAWTMNQPQVHHYEIAPAG